VIELMSPSVLGSGEDLSARVNNTTGDLRVRLTLPQPS
jgi:hypothetical protein